RVNRVLGIPANVVVTRLPAMVQTFSCVAGMRTPLPMNDSTTHTPCIFSRSAAGPLGRGAGANARDSRTSTGRRRRMGTLHGSLRCRAVTPEESKYPTLPGFNRLIPVGEDAAVLARPAGGVDRVVLGVDPDTLPFLRDAAVGRAPEG